MKEMALLHIIKKCDIYHVGILFLLRSINYTQYANSVVYCD